MMEELFKEIEMHLLQDEKPSIYLNKILNEGKLDEYPLNFIKGLKEIEQNLKHHPEGHVWNHLMLVIDEGAANRNKSRDKRVFMWGLLLHDIGKLKTTKLRKGRWTSYDHDKVGAEMTREFLEFFNQNPEFIDKVSSVVRWHMQSLFVNNKLPFGDIKNMLREIEVEEIALVSLSDRMGRGEMDELKREETKQAIENFRRVCLMELEKSKKNEPD